jgi:hypothetical protein
MTEPNKLSWPAKVRLLARIWMSYLRVVIRSRRPLPEQVRALGANPVRPARPVAPDRLGRAIHRGLRLGPITPRCLPKALVLYEILREQGQAPELVIGLPNKASSHEAHAWVELNLVDVGPPPGRAGHEEMVRYS